MNSSIGGRRPRVLTDSQYYKAKYEHTQFEQLNHFPAKNKFWQKKSPIPVEFAKKNAVYGKPRVKNTNKFKIRIPKQ